jgi:lipid II:glycine glycyltransferase (peptidoglycan interpeptide bridge formation enzyme)
MYYSAVRLSAELGATLANFGGGTTADDDDKLFRYKKKFSSNIKEVYIGKKIIDPSAYASIIRQWEGRYPHLKEKYSNFFLKYRQTE